MHPRHGVPKSYRAAREGRARRGGARPAAGGHRARRRADGARGRRSRGSSVIDITIHEGRNRQVRRMCAAVGHPVIHLHRTAYAGITAGRLEPGKWRDAQPRRGRGAPRCMTPSSSAPASRASRPPTGSWPTAPTSSCSRGQPGRRPRLDAGRPRRPLGGGRRGRRPREHPPPGAGRGGRRGAPAVGGRVGRPRAGARRVARGRAKRRARLAGISQPARRARPPRRQPRGRRPVHGCRVDGPRRRRDVRPRRRRDGRVGDVVDDAGQAHVAPRAGRQVGRPKRRRRRRRAAVRRRGGRVRRDAGGAARRSCPAPVRGLGRPGAGRRRRGRVRRRAAPCPARDRRRAAARPGPDRRASRPSPTGSYGVAAKSLIELADDLPAEPDGRPHRHRARLRVPARRAEPREASSGRRRPRGSWRAGPPERPTRPSPRRCGARSACASRGSRGSPTRGAT